jgi:S-adenosylmethionine uptake transporter
MSLTRRETGAVLLAALANAGAGALVLSVKEDPGFSPIVAMAIRVAANLLLLLLFFRPSIEIRSPFRQPTLWAWGFFGALTSYCYFGALPLAGAGLTNFLSAGSGVFIGAFAPFFLGRKTTGVQWLGILVSFFAMYLIAAPEGRLGEGFLLAICSGIFAAFAYLMVAHRSSRESVAVVMSHWTIPNLALCAFFLIFSTPNFPTLPLTWIVLFVAGIMVASAQALLSIAYKSGEAQSIACLSYATPVFGLFFDLLLFGLEISLNAWLGCALILAFGMSLPLIVNFREGAAGAFSRRIRRKNIADKA